MSKTNLAKKIIATALLAGSLSACDNGVILKPLDIVNTAPILESNITTQTEFRAYNEINFNVKANDKEGNSTFCSIDFGDGTPKKVIGGCSDGIDFKHFYEKGGIYNVTTTVGDIINGKIDYEVEETNPLYIKSYVEEDTVAQVISVEGLENKIEGHSTVKLNLNGNFYGTNLQDAYLAYRVFGTNEWKKENLFESNATINGEIVINGNKLTTDFSVSYDASKKDEVDLVLDENGSGAVETKIFGTMNGMPFETPIKTNIYTPNSKTIGKVLKGFEFESWSEFKKCNSCDYIVKDLGVDMIAINKNTGNKRAIEINSEKRSLEELAFIENRVKNSGLSLSIFENNFAPGAIKNNLNHLK